MSQHPGVRKLFDVQLALGAIPIEKVEIPIKTRDELPPILAALQWIFTTPEVNREVFSVLESIQPADKKSTGRPGMASLRRQLRLPRASTPRPTCLRHDP